MAQTIEFLTSHRVNRKEYKRGDVLSVSSSIYKILTVEGIAKDYEEKKVEKPKKPKASKPKEDK